MKVEMLRNCVAGRQPRKAGDIVELRDKEAEALVLDGSAKYFTLMVVASENTSLGSGENAMLPASQKKGRGSRTK